MSDLEPCKMRARVHSVKNITHERQMNIIQSHNMGLKPLFWLSALYGGTSIKPRTVLWLAETTSFSTTEMPD